MDVGLLADPVGAFAEDFCCHCDCGMFGDLVVLVVMFVKCSRLEFLVSRTLINALKALDFC